MNKHLLLILLGYQKIKSATKVLHLKIFESKKLERETRFELATSTLARLRSTN